MLAFYCIFDSCRFFKFRTAYQDGGKILSRERKTQEFMARFLKLIIDWIKKHNCKVSNKIKMISQILNDIFSYSNTKKEPHFHFTSNDPTYPKNAQHHLDQFWHFNAYIFIVYTRK